MKSHAKLRVACVSTECSVSHTPLLIPCLTTLVTWNIDDLRSKRAIRGDVQVADGDLEVEAAGTTGARIEVEHALMRPDGCLVGMAVEYGRKFGRRRVEVERAEIVQQV